MSRFSVGNLKEKSIGYKDNMIDNRKRNGIIDLVVQSVKLLNCT